MAAEWASQNADDDAADEATDYTSETAWRGNHIRFGDSEDENMADDDDELMMDGDDVNEIVIGKRGGKTSGKTVRGHPLELLHQTKSASCSPHAFLLAPADQCIIICLVAEEKFCLRPPSWITVHPPSQGFKH